MTVLTELDRMREAEVRLAEIAQDCASDIDSYVLAASVAREHASDIRLVLEALPLLRAEIERLRREDWQPIETAPKPEEGAPRLEVILAWTNSDGLHVVGEAYWHAGEQDWWWANTSPGDYFSDSITNSITGQITHWRPLPAPPASQPEEG